MDHGITGVELTSRELVGLGIDAYEVGQYKLHSRDGGLLDDGKFLVIWRLEDGQWRLHRDIYNTSRTPRIKGRKKALKTSNNVPEGR